MKRSTARSLWLLAGWCLFGSLARGADDLPSRIDALIAAAAKDGPLAPPADDATFLRRVSLDLIGRIPTPTETTRFLEDSDPAKRTKRIDALLASPEHPRRMADLFHALLMERRGDNPEWSKFLESSFAANKPWDRLVRDILDPNAEDETLRGAAYFHTRRLEKVGQQETDYPGLTRDVGRLFLGMDLQCAQCHNHLFVDEYKQLDFQGLFVVYQNTFIRTDVKFPALGEKLLAKKGEFMSVFDKVAATTGPRVPGRSEIEIPTFDKGQEYLQPPDRKTNFPGTPRFRALQSIAADLTAEGNRAFADNIANRLWFVMMGRGLVHPLDMHHVGNPPSHPELLALLRTEIVARRYDVRSMLRDLARTQTYQRSTTVASGTEPPKPESYRTALEKRTSAEQIMLSVWTATGPRDATGATPRGDAEKLRATFVKALGNTPQEPEIDFSPSLKSALFLLNDAAVLDCLTPQPGYLTDRIAKLTDAAAVAQELYFCILTRSPTDEEKQFVADYLGKHPDRRPAALANLAWALLASTEFCLNH